MPESPFESSLPIIGIGPQKRITMWNEAMARLLELPHAEAIGRPCFEVLRGRDVHGNEYCGPNCPIDRSLACRRPIQPFELVVPSRSGQHSLRIAPLWSSARHCYVVVSSASSQSVEPLERAAVEASVLSAREREILGELASGRGTKEIASAFFLSSHTVRNHVQRILHKLGARSRLEAVAIARDRALL
ncbi:MAG: LuxR C-terminal-related transcriptional regulator [Sandaracinaceae bacterium]|nr:LuxR C-terminal-related transcriptional regulator [Sandaracinaceae bacterium]